MKRLIFAFGMIGAGLCSHAAHAAPADCLASPAAVFAAHPNAAHASYSLRVNGSQRCWYADAFKSEAKAAAKSPPRPAASAAPTSPPHPAIAMRAQPRTEAVAPAPWPRTAAVASASPLVTVPFPSGTPPSIHTVNAQALNQLLAVDTPADFESRFSASGYRGRK